MFGLESAWHWLILAGIVFLLFGNRLPSVMRSLGQGVVEFKKGLQGIEDEVKGSGNTSNRIEEQPTSRRRRKKPCMAIATPPQGSAMPALFAFLDNPVMMLILGVIAVLLFGERLPEVARSVGKGLMELKRGIRSIQDDVEGAINSSTSTRLITRFAL